jgi:hypothetical protein
LASRDSQSGAIVELFHPRRHVWHEHFAVRGARIVGTTQTGRVTVRLLDMNDSRRVRLRRELLRQNRFG